MSLYLFLLGRQESPHHYIPSAQASLTQPDLQLVGHSNTHSALPDVFHDASEPTGVCHSGTKLLSPSTWPHITSQLPVFRKRNDPGNLHTYSWLYKQVTKPLPIPPHPDSHCHQMLTSGTSSSGKATSPTPRWQNTVRKIIFPLRFGSECDFCTHFHFYLALPQTYHPWTVSCVALTFLLYQYKHQVELLGFIINSRTHPHICYSQLNSTFYEIANAKIIEHHITLSPCMAESP